MSYQNGRGNGVYIVMTGILIIFALFKYPTIGFSILGALVIIWLVSSNWEYLKTKFFYVLMIIILTVWVVSCVRGFTGY